MTLLKLLVRCASWSARTASIRVAKSWASYHFFQFSLRIKKCSGAWTNSCCKPKDGKPSIRLTLIISKSLMLPVTHLVHFWSRSPNPTNAPFFLEIFRLLALAKWRLVSSDVGLREAPVLRHAHLEMSTAFSLEGGTSRSLAAPNSA